MGRVQYDRGRYHRTSQRASANFINSGDQFWLHVGIKMGIEYTMFEVR
jgi:hypothetical protein